MAQTSSLPPDVGLVTKEDFVPDSEGSIPFLLLEC